MLGNDSQHRDPHHPPRRCQMIHITGIPGQPVRLTRRRILAVVGQDHIAVAVDNVAVSDALDE